GDGGHRLVHADAILKVEHGGAGVQKRRQQRRQVIVGGGFQRHDHQIDRTALGGRSGDLYAIRRQREVAVGRLDRDAVRADVVHVATGDEGDVVTGARQPTAVVKTEGAGTENGDAGE